MDISSAVALVCELPKTHALPLSRWSTADVAGEVRRSGLVATISDSTVWRWLNEDAICPWQHRCWIFPRDPQFNRTTKKSRDLSSGNSLVAILRLYSTR